MTFTQLRALVAVVESGGFTSAATLTGTSQPAVSHAVAALERELGVELISREPGVVQPTDLGRRVARLARAILEGAEQIRHEAHNGLGIAAPVQVAVTTNVAADLLPAALSALGERHPGIEVTVLEGATDEIPSWLRSNLVDVAFLCWAPSLDDFEHERLGEVEHVAVLPANHPLLERHAVAPGLLTSEPFVMVNCGCEPYIRQIFNAVGSSVEPAYYVRETRAIGTIVAHGMGVSIVSGLSVGDLPDGVAVRPLEPPARRELAAFWPHRPKTAAARAIVNAFRDVLSGPRGRTEHVTV
jgi:DNA-binding transcriptional LysR family regulator